MACYTVVTPINKIKTTNSNKDYKEQLERLKKGEQLMWDDTKNNSTKKSGGFFGFVHNSKCVDICMILDIKDPKNRLPSWSKNVGQGDRNVLYLSDPIVKIPWDLWIRLNCPKKIQGTTIIKSAHESLTNYLAGFAEYISETGEIILKK